MYPPTYHTKRFAIAPYKAADAERFVVMGTDRRVMENMSGVSGDPEEEKSLFESIFKVYERKEDTRWFWIWGIYENDRLCGHLELKETDHTAADELEIVYMVHPEERGKGLMTEILDYIKAHHMTLWKRAIIATVDPKNDTSLYLLRRWGVLREEWVKDPDGDTPYLKLWMATS